MKLEEKTCRLCGAKIGWVTMESGAKMPVELATTTVIVPIKEYRDPDLNVPVLEEKEDAGGERCTTLRGHEAHWAHCPRAKEFKKR